MAQFIIGIIIVVLGVILTTVGGYVAKDGWDKMYRKDTSVDIQQNATGNDNTQAATAGDNSPIITRGDYVAGDKTVNIIISDPILEAKVKQIANEQNDGLTKKYPHGSAAFGIAQKGFVVLKGLVPSGLKINWETGRVLLLSSERVQIKVPQIIVNTEHYKSGLIAGNIVDLPKRIGAKSRLIRTKDYSVVIEIIGIDNDMVIASLGLAPTD
jgi:hypothetical protein